MPFSLIDALYREGVDPLPGLCAPADVLTRCPTRAGQSSEKAAMIYQHSNLERQREVAEGIDARVRAMRGEGPAISHLAREG